MNYNSNPNANDRFDPNLNNNFDPRNSNIPHNPTNFQPQNLPNNYIPKPNIPANIPLNKNSSNQLSQSSKKTRNWIWFLLIVLLVPAILIGFIAVDILSSKSNITPNTSSNISSQSSQIVNNSNIVPMSSKDIVANNLPAILSINITVDSSSRQKSIAGTGYIVGEDGIVITNRHVVSSFCKDTKGVRIVGLSYDDKVYELDLESIDPIDDIAILKIKNLTQKLPTVVLGDSNKVALGDDVLAIGNALGTFNDTVTKGIISGVNRSFDAGGLSDDCNGDSNIDGLIQTDAAINPGNSGGPLFNNLGQVIGMNTLGSPDAQSIGLAIPSNTIKNSLNSYQKNKLIIRPRLGVVSQEINPVTKVEYPSLPVDYGEFVGSLAFDIDPKKVVSKGSVAEEIGLKYGDIIIEINSKKLNSQRSNQSPLRREILNKQVGDSIELTVLKAVDSNGTLSYQSVPKNLKFTLKGIYYDLNKRTLGVTN